MNKRYLVSEETDYKTWVSVPYLNEMEVELDMDDLPVNATPSQVADLIEEYIRLKA